VATERIGKISRQRKLTDKNGGLLIHLNALRIFNLKSKTHFCIICAGKKKLKTKFDASSGLRRFNQIEIKISRFVILVLSDIKS